MSAAFTPGPWEVADDDHNGQAIVRAEHTEIATCWHHCVGSIEKEMRHNASLIAAAPDLYCQLQNLAAAVENLLSADPDMPTYQADYDDAESAMESAKSALAKARAEQSL